MSEPIKPSKVSRYLDSETWDALKAAGFTDEELSADTGQMGPVIFAYTRAQAIEDGVLVDVTALDGQLVKEAGFKVHIAVTATAFGESVASHGQELPAGQSIKGRLWDVLMVLRFCIASGRTKGPRCDFSVSVDDGEGKHRKVDLYALLGPGDNGEPVLTIMLPEED